MKTIIAIWLVFYKGYSVMRFVDEHNYKYGACNDKLDFDYMHHGKWGEGNTAVDAIIDCYKKTKS
jgi:hypothetical protein